MSGRPMMPPARTGTPTETATGCSAPLFGYIWVSGYGWGYLPFQCGVWNYYGNFGWGWSPGRGGCSPWWRNGHYGGPNIGTGYAGYRPPVIPRRHPFGDGNGANGGGPRMIAVNRQSSSGADVLPVRDRSTPVVIAGHTVQPLRPLSPRPQYDRVGSAFITHTSSGYTITGQAPRTSSGSGYNGGSGSSGYHSSGSTAPRSSGSGGGQRSTAPVSHSSSGEHSGGGGGGYHGGGGGSSSSGNNGTHR